MDIPDKIRYAAQRLKKGHRVNRITVRDFLGHFGAERRGAAKVEQIKAILESLQIQTEPNFETVWIDEPIWLKLKDGALPTENIEAHADRSGNNPEDANSEEIVLESTPSAVRQALEQSESAPTSSEPEAPDRSEESSESSDPTFRIGSLPAANKTLIVVNQGDSIATAVTLMLQHDFSQLPVMQGEREVKGVITWKSICARLAFGSKCDHVADCREEARIVDANRTLFDVITTIVEYGYVLVRQRDRKITGIVTASDLSLQFHALTEPFFLLREIELHVRRLLKGKLSADDLSNAGSPPPKRTPKDISDLTFGEYVGLFQAPETWAKLKLKIDRSVLTKLLEEVRKIRNDVMHFDPDPMTTDELGTLKRAVRFMQELYAIFP